MTKFEVLQQAHQELLDRIDNVTDKAAFAREVQDYVTRVCNEAVDVPAPRDRDQLRANLRYWASYLYDATGTYPNTTMRPARVGSMPEPEPPRPPAASRGCAPRLSVWGITAAVVLIIVVAVFALVASSIGRLMPTTATEPSQPSSMATQVNVQMTVNAAMTKIVEASATPTPLPTHTPTPTETPSPSPTPTAIPTLTPTPIVVLLGTPILPEVPRVVLPLDVGYQIITQGPSPFDPTVWVIQVKLVGRGGNDVYIYWVNGDRLSGDEYTVQGTRCEPQVISLGVTSEGQAVKHDFTLQSPLAECLATPTP